jgi:hypothetical protein
MKRYGYKINKDGNIRIKFENDNTGNKRVNIDNVQMSDWEDPDGMEAIQNSKFKIQDGVYDLSGRKAEHLRKGICIINNELRLMNEATPKRNN